jgi:hypothetical protein
MNYLSASLTTLADATTAANAMTLFISPMITTLSVIASLVFVGFLVNGGIQIMASSGRPEKLQHAKNIIKNSLIGLVVVLAAVTTTSILSNTYKSSGSTTNNEIPILTEIKPAESSGGLVEVLIDAVIGLLKNIIETAAKPFIDALSYFTKSTPMMATNSSVFNLWLVILGIADVLFVLVVILLGFHIMSASTLGLNEIEFKHLIPQLIFVFLLMNSSIFIIDAIINLSNGMIQALQAGFSSSSVWDSLSTVASNSKDLKLAALLIFIVFIILTVILLVYYILRLVTLFIGAVMAPLVLLLWLIPSFKDFASNALRTYLVTIFVLFIHVVILALAASIFGGMTMNDLNRTLDPIMSMLVGVAAILALLKTQGVISQLAFASSGARMVRKLGGQFVNGVSYMGSRVKSSRASAAKKASKNITVLRVPSK